MLMIYGVVAIVAGALIAAVAGLLFHRATVAEPVRRLLGGQSFGVFVASLMGLGLVMMVAFLSSDKSQSPVLVEALVAVAIAVAGFVAVRAVGRMASTLSNDAAGRPLAVDQPKRAA